MTFRKIIIHTITRLLKRSDKLIHPQYNLHLTAFGAGMGQLFPCVAVYLEDASPLQTAADNNHRWRYTNDP